MRFSRFHLLTLILAVPGFVLQVMKLLRLQENGALTANARFDGAVMVAVWAIIIVGTLAAARASAKQAIGLEAHSQPGQQASGLRSFSAAGEMFALGFQKRPIAAVLLLLFFVSLPVVLVLLAYGWSALLERRELWISLCLVEVGPLLVIWHTFRAARRMRSN